jgi:hypothetical protein
MEKENSGVLMETKDWPLSFFYNSFTSILNLENNANVLLVYMTYCALSFWEDGEDTTDFMCEKTGLDKPQFLKAKKALLELGLIELTETGLTVHFYLEN